MKKSILTLFLLIIATDVFAFEMWGDAAYKFVALAPVTSFEARTFAARVVADGGTVVDIKAVDKAIKQAKVGDYWSSLKAAYSPSWGVKGTTSASKLYSLTGTDYDLAQATGAYQPTINLTGINSKPTIRMDAVNKYLSASFAFNQPETVIMALQANTWSASKYIWDGNALNTMAMGQVTYDTPGDPHIQGYAGTWFGNNYPTGESANLLEHMKPRVLTSVYSGTGSYIQINNAPKITGDSGSVNAGGFSLGSSSSISADIDILGVYLLASSSDSLITSARNNINQQYNVYGGGRPKIIFDGDSLTRGTQASLYGQYPYQTMALINGDWETYNMGIPGTNMSAVYTAGATRIDPFYDSTASKNIVVVWVGTNDLFVGGLGNSVYGSLKLYCQGRKAKGFKVVVLTIIPRTDVGTVVGFEAERVILNTLIRTDLVNYVDAIADVAADTRLQTTVNTAYFSTDLVHLNSMGYGVVAGIVAPIILGL